MQWIRGPMTQLHIAAGTGSAEAVETLISSANIDQGDPQGHTPLHFAATLGSSQVVKILLDNGANVSIPNHEGFTALISCAQQGHLAVCKMLLEAGAELEAANSKGSTPLYLAATRGHRKVVEALLEAGANIDCRREAGTTPLFSVAEGGRLDMVKLLLRAKADALLTRTDPTGDVWVPLDAAVAVGNLEVVCELIRQRGVDGCGGTSGGVNALCLAIQFQPVHVLAVLMDAGVIDTGEALRRAADCGHEAHTALLLRRATGGLAYPNKSEQQGRREHRGMTPLLLAAGLGPKPSPRIVRLLVDAGADAYSIVSLEKGGTEVGRDVPLGYTLVSLRYKKLRGLDATEEQLQRLEGVRRLLMRVEAVSAESWMWTAEQERSLLPGSSCGGRVKAVRSRTRPTAGLAILRRRAARRGLVLRALFMYSKKVGPAMVR